MPIVIKLQDIDEAIENLRYKNETTLKSRLLRAVRQYYFDDASAESLQSIDTEELVRTIWETGDDRDLLKTKRKNFSSLKSSVNTDLKKLYTDGKNPQGLVIGHNNTFAISDEAKDKALAGIMDAFKEKGIDTQSKISDMLSALSDVLANTLSNTEAENTKEEIERLKNVLGDITGKMGLSLEDIVQQTKDAGERGVRISGSGKTPMDLPGKGDDLAGYIRGGLSEIDSSLQGLAREIQPPHSKLSSDEMNIIASRHAMENQLGSRLNGIEDAPPGASKTGLTDSMLTALQEIIHTLQDAGTDPSGKAGRIMAAVERMLGDAIDGAGSGLSGDEAGQLKQIFHKMTAGTDAAGDQEAAAAGTAGDKLAAAVSSIVGDGELSAGEKIKNIMAVMNEAIDETLALGGAGLSDEAIAGIREMMGGMTGNLAALSKGAVTNEENKGGGEGVAAAAKPETGDVKSMPEELTGAAGSEAAFEQSLLDAVAEIVHALKDTGTDASGKAGKIMAAVQQILSDAVDGAGDDISGDQAIQLKQIFHDIGKGKGFDEDAGQGGQPARLSEGEQEANQAVTTPSPTGDRLFSEFASILGEGGLSPGDKINRIMAAVNEMISEVLTAEGAGLTNEEIAGIKEMMGNITDNLEAFVQEALTGFDIVEEITEEGGEDAVGEYEITESPEGVAEEVAVSPAEVITEPEGGDARLAAAGGEGEPGSGEGEIIEETLSGGELDAETMEIVEATDEEIAKAQAGQEVSEETALSPEEAVEEVAVPTDGVVLSTEEAAALDEGTAPTDTAAKTEGEAAVGKAVEGALSGEAGTGDFDAETMEIVEATDPEIAKAQTGPEVSEETAFSPEEVVEEVAVPADGIIEEIEVLVSPEAEEAGDTAISSEGQPVSGEGEIIEEAGTGEFDAETMEIVEATDEEIAKAQAGQEVSQETALSPEEVVEEVAVPPDGVVLSPEEAAALDEGTGMTDAAISGGGDASLAAGAGGGSGDSSGGVRVTPAGKDIDGDLREKADLLTRLAEAAGALAALGPDLSGSVYTEEEIREKAQFLSEEFNRYLSVRDKFYNAHILIKGGNYLVGGAHLAKSELAEQIATLPDFYIGKFPVTNALFEIFVEQTGYVTTAEKYGYSIVYYPRMQRSRDPITGVERFSLHNQAYSKKVPGACWHRPLGPDSSLHLKRTHPVVHVSLEDARAFAAWTGKRLPTEIEWEAAARTARGYLYPWGDEWKENACNIEKSLHGDTTPVDQYVTFANSAGVADLLGNVLEWTSDIIGDRDTSDTCIAKGASWIAHSEISLTDRHYIEKNVSSNILGFRCVAI